MNFLIFLTRSTKSLQLPSLTATSVMTRVPLCADSSKPEAALMLRTHSTVMPRALNSFSMLGSGPLLATMRTVLGSCSPGIIVSLDLHARGVESQIAVSYRKLMANRQLCRIEVHAKSLLGTCPRLWTLTCYNSKT